MRTDPIVALGIIAAAALAAFLLVALLVGE
jgi:hypothetical protein